MILLLADGKNESFGAKTKCPLIRRLSASSPRQASHGHTAIMTSTERSSGSNASGYSRSTRAGGCSKTSALSALMMSTPPGSSRPNTVIRRAIFALLCGVARVFKTEIRPFSISVGIVIATGCPEHARTVMKRMREHVRGCSGPWTISAIFPDIVDFGQIRHTPSSKCGKFDIAHASWASAAPACSKIETGSTHGSVIQFPFRWDIRLIVCDAARSRHGPENVLDHALERIDLGAQSIHGGHLLSAYGYACSWRSSMASALSCSAMSVRVRGRNRIPFLHQVGKGFLRFSISDEVTAAFTEVMVPRCIAHIFADGRQIRATRHASSRAS